MTEPDVASSDATNIATRIQRDGDEYVINGRKWWSSGAMNPRCAILIVMGKTDPDAERHRQQCMILVPRDTPGVNVKRGMRVFGYTDGSHGGHAEISFTDVRVPAANLIAGEGDGFAIAQARLGPGRIHHCMRQIGAAERAVELMCQRVVSRVAFGRPLAEQGVIEDWIAEARVRIEQARLLVLKTAWLMDTVGNRGAHTEIQAIKIVTPAMAEWVLDKAIQAHGAAGHRQDSPLAGLWASGPHAALRRRARRGAQALAGPPRAPQLRASSRTRLQERDAMPDASTRVAVVTGAARGIGAATAKRLAAGRPRRRRARPGGRRPARTPSTRSPARAAGAGRRLPTSPGRRRSRTRSQRVAERARAARGSGQQRRRDPRQPAVQDDRRRLGHGHERPPARARS